MKTKMILVLCGLLSQTAIAAECPQINGRIVVIGGVGATTPAMQACYPNMLAMSFADAQKNVKCLADQIDKNTSGQKITVAGHSSGAAWAENIARAVKDKNKIRLKRLEGYGSAAGLAGVETECWYAENESNSKLQGMNAPSMLNRESGCPQPPKVYKSPQCKTKLCLHISLVNTATPEDVTRETAKNALDKCVGNMAWANDSASGKATSGALAPVKAVPSSGRP